MRQELSKNIWVMQANSGGFKNIYSAITLFGDGSHFLKETSWRGEQRMVGELLLNLGVTFEFRCYFSKLGVTFKVGRYL